ncbi:MAG: hypothetical protein P0S94_03395 [Simkaniaceae bacterium]|nr:hypothetical protein [Simkaniaceae bacterium]
MNPLRLKAALLEMLYPSVCVGCGSEVAEDVLCQCCMAELQLIDSHLRCVKCFAPLQEGKCRRPHILGCYAAALFEQDSPAKKLLAFARAKEAERLIKLFASSMILQADRLKWPEPDLIIAAPRYKSLNAHLSQELARNYEIPNISAFAPNRSGMNIALRPHIPNITDQNIYLIDEKLTKNTTTFAKTLYPLSPKKVYALSILDGTCENV